MGNDLAASGSTPPQTNTKSAPVEPTEEAWVEKLVSDLAWHDGRHTLVDKAVKTITAKLREARIDELENLDRQAEVIGVGYSIVRTDIVRDRIKQLEEEDEASGQIKA